jgi:lipoprotein-releasing system permease protein
MNLPYFIAQRLISGRREGTSFSRPINVIAIVGIAVGLAVMIIAVSILTGFKQQIRDKVVGFGSHIQITNLDNNISFETAPISTKLDFVPRIKSLPGIRHVEVFATKAGIIKTDENIQGVVLKGIGPDFEPAQGPHRGVVRAGKDSSYPQEAPSHPGSRRAGDWWRPARLPEI